VARAANVGGSYGRLYVPKGQSSIVFTAFKRWQKVRAQAGEYAYSAATWEPRASELCIFRSFALVFVELCVSGLIALDLEFA